MTTEHCSIGKVADPNYMGDCEACGEPWPCREALRRRLVEVEAERDAWRRVFGDADGTSPLEKFDALAARLAEVEQALRRYGRHLLVCDVLDPNTPDGDERCDCGLAAVLDKGEQTDDH